MLLLPPTWLHSRLLLKCICFQYSYLWVWLGQQNPIPTSWRVLLIMKLLISLCCYVLNSSFTDNCHKLGNIGKHLYALLVTNTLHPRSCELWFQMRNAHHQQCISCNIVGISKSSRQCLKTWSWLSWYDLPCTKEKHKTFRASFFFCSWL